MEGLTALPLLPLLMGTEEPSSLLWLKEKEGPAAAPEEVHRGPSTPRSVGSSCRAEGTWGREEPQLWTLWELGLNRLGDCLLAMGSEEQERFGWTGASWEGSPWSKAQAVSLWAENINC